MNTPAELLSPCDCREPRRHQQQGVIALEEMADRVGVEDLAELLHELRHRTPARAVRLRERVWTRLSAGDEARPAVVGAADCDLSPASIRDSSAAGLTDGQQAVVAAPVDTHSLVTAGPGTGKTHVLVHRIAALVQSADVAPGSEVLVLTFSRAAVGEARRRVREFGGRVSWVRAYTFDSFATGLLSEFDPDGSWVRAGYDSRIRAANRMILENDAVAARLQEYRHIFIDELQDVVGARAELVLTILMRAQCGWTLFGDPAQGIYNFQLEGDARRVGAAALYREVRKQFASTVREHYLTENFRALSPMAQAGLWAGTELNAVEPDYPSIRRRLQTTFFGLPVAPPVSALPSLAGTVGILCRTNGQALLVSRELWMRGVAHRVRRSAADRAAPPWLARLFRGVRATSLGRRAFDGLWSELLPAPELAQDEAWSQIQTLGGSAPNAALDIDRIVGRLRTGFLPDEFDDRAGAQITVSTIHRAKGLEYDHVFVLRIEERETDDLAEEARLLYVALARARLDLASWPSPSVTGMRTIEHSDEPRWIRKSFTPPYLTACEVRPDDINRDAPAGFGTGDGVVAERQIYITNEVQIGDSIELRLVNPRDGTYGLFHRNVLVGTTVDAFSKALGGQLRGRDKRWPVAIHELRVEGIDTVAGDDAAALNSGLSGVPAWLRVRAHGLGELEFEGTSKTEQEHLLRVGTYVMVMTEAREFRSRYDVDKAGTPIPRVALTFAEVETQQTVVGTFPLWGTGKKLRDVVVACTRGDEKLADKLMEEIDWATKDVEQLFGIEVDIDVSTGQTQNRITRVRQHARAAS